VRYPVKKSALIGMCLSASPSVCTTTLAPCYHQVICYLAC
jgi:hypothetical protein